MRASRVGQALLGAGLTGQNRVAFRDKNGPEYFRGLGGKANVVMARAENPGVSDSIPSLPTIFLVADVHCSHGGYRGYIVHPDGPGARPGVLMAHHGKLDETSQ